ncbi:methyl-accepting chemotaxis protein [Lachnospiraceae bacterium ZAX-1]
MFHFRRKKDVIAEIEKRLISKQTQLDYYAEVMAEVSERQEEAATCFQNANQYQSEMERQLAITAEALNIAFDERRAMLQEEEDVVQSLAQVSHNMEESDEYYGDFVEQIREQNSKMQLTVYSGAKEFVQRILDEIGGIQKVATQMNSFANRMGVISLNAAIEAGRMGDKGRKFVNSAEEVRNFSEKYQVAAEELSKQAEQICSKLNAQQEQVCQMNESTKQMMKDLSDQIKQIEQSEKLECANQLKKISETMNAAAQNNQHLLKEIITALNALELANEHFHKEQKAVESLEYQLQYMKSQLEALRQSSRE